MRRLLLLAALLLAAAPAAAREATFSVAVSMKEVVEELGARLTATRPGLTLRYNLGASGVLQKQIEAGAPVDLFVSAAPRQMDALERRGLIVAASRRAVARNVLVAVGPADAVLDLARPADLAGPRVTRLAVGSPRTVPAGQYAEESLRALGLWERLAPRLIHAENVRQVLDWVARGEVEAGIVYATDAAVARGRVRERFRLPEDTHRPIVYPVAVVTGAAEPAVAEAFIALLVSPEGQAVLARHGFLPAPVGAR